MSLKASTELLAGRLTRGDPTVDVGRREFAWAGLYFDPEKVRSVAYTCLECGVTYKEVPLEVARQLQQHQCLTDVSAASASDSEQGVA